MRRYGRDFYDRDFDRRPSRATPGDSYYGYGSGGYYGYRMSKAALNAAGVSLAIDLKGRGVAVAILHPGAVRTEMTGGAGMIDADEAVRGILRRIDELTLDGSGRFLHQNGQPLPW